MLSFHSAKIFSVYGMCLHSTGTPYPSSPSSTGSISPQRHALKRQRSPDHPSQKTTKMSSPPDKSKSIKRTNDQGGEGEDLPRRGVHRIMLPPDPLEKKSRRIDSRDQVRVRLSLALSNCYLLLRTSADQTMFKCFYL